MSIENEGHQQAHKWVALVTGGRDFSPSKVARAKLDSALCGAVVMFSGDARGFDSFALERASHGLIPVYRCPALWEHEGNSAGPRRNSRMLAMGRGTARELGIGIKLIAGPGGRGTADMCAKAKAVGIEVIEIPP